MRPCFPRSAIAPAQGYICLCCRRQLALSPRTGNRRNKHDNGSSRADREAAASKPSLAAALRAFLSGNRVQSPETSVSEKATNNKHSAQLGEEQNPASDENFNTSQRQPAELAKFKPRPGPENAKAMTEIKKPTKEVQSKLPSTTKWKYLEDAIHEQNHNDSSNVDPANVVSLKDPPSEVKALDQDTLSSSGMPHKKDTKKLILPDRLDIDLNGANDPMSTKEAKETPKARTVYTSKNSEKNNVSKHLEMLLVQSIEEATKDSEKASEDDGASTDKKQKASTGEPNAVTKTKEKRDAKLGRSPKTNIEPRRRNLKKAQPQNERATVAKRKVRQQTVVRKCLNEGRPLIRKHKSSDSRSPHEKVPSVKAPRTAGLSKGLPAVIESVKAWDLNILPVQVEQPPVPNLAHGLDRVLFNTGVYQLQDPRSRVFNFDPYLQKIMPLAEFDFDALRDYVTSSKDEALQLIAKRQGKRYVGSTSSMTGVLAHFHFLLSQWRSINISMLSKSYPNHALTSFTDLQRSPQAIFLRQTEGLYAIDADKQFDTSNVLSMLGKSMEKLLTLETQEFERYRRSNPETVSEREINSPESYHYSTMGDFLMRSQLDAHDPRLPGSGMFDLKTRAVVSIRMDVSNFEYGMGYEIKNRHGEWESYEREYYDMIRAAFLKYSMQVRMGRMDGIFVAFHNIERIFGFQYISLAEMDNTIHGQWDTSLGDQEFKLSLHLLNQVLEKATKKYPNTSIRLHFETRDAATPFMYIFAEPVTEEQIDEIQNGNLEKAQEFDRRVLGRQLRQDDGPKWADIQANVEKAMDRDEQGLEESKVSGKAHDELDHSDDVHNHDICTDASELSGSEAESLLSTDMDEYGNDENSEIGELEETNDTEEEREEPSRAEISGNDQVNEDKGNNEEKQPSTFSRSDLVEESSLEDTIDNAPDEPSGEEEAPSDNIEDSESFEGHSEREVSDTEVVSPESASVDSDDLSSSAHISEDTEFATEADRPFLDDISSERSSDSQPNASTTDILAMTLTLRNKVNGHYVLRPTDMKAEDKWEIEYSLVEVPEQSRAQALYQACQTRRQKKLEVEEVEEGQKEALSGYQRTLRAMSAKARDWRKDLDKKDSERGGPVKVLGREPEDL